MKADTMTLQGVFYGDKRFVVPVYQRPYVWDMERQWEPLWADVEATVRRLLDVRTWAHLQNAQVSEADSKAAPHFLGAVVIEQHPTPIDEPPIRAVVDGQQRLTTLQLLLRGVLDSMIAEGVTGTPVAKVRRLLRNDPETASGDALFKVLPRPAEREAFAAAMAEDAPDEGDSTFSAARHFFASSSTSFLRDSSLDTDPVGEGDDLHKRAALLVSTLVGLVKLVVIDLEDVDDAQVIFEALNARNTPLSATDLVKNLLFMRAQSQGGDPQALYDRIWARFDSGADWWRGVVGVGHAQRARQDWLLGDWLIAEQGRAINVGRLYGEFRSWLDSSKTTPVEALEAVGSYANAFEMLYGRLPGASAAEIQAFGRIEQLNITVATPVLLWLLIQPQSRVSPSKRELCFRALESFVVRRMAVKWQTRGYGAVFVEVLKAAKASDDPAQAIIEALSAGPYGYTWPRDADLTESFANARYYGPGGISQERLRLLLAAADRQAQGAYHMSEPVTVQYDALQIEHIMPQEWRTHWALSADNPMEKDVLERERDRIVNSIGNLTLVSSRLNPAMSNGSWERKRGALKEHAHLRLNAAIAGEPVWGEDQIIARGERLADAVAKAWPGPDDGIWAPAAAGDGR